MGVRRNIRTRRTSERRSTKTAKRVGRSHTSTKRAGNIGYTTPVPAEARKVEDLNYEAFVPVEEIDIPLEES